MTAYRFEVPATVMMTVFADTEDEARKLAADICANHIDGDDLDNWDENSTDNRLYVGDMPSA